MNTFSKAPLLGNILPAQLPPRVTLEFLAVHPPLNSLQVVKRASHIKFVAQGLVTQLDALRILLKLLDGRSLCR